MFLDNSKQRTPYKRKIDLSGVYGFACKETVRMLNITNTDNYFILSIDDIQGFSAWRRPIRHAHAAQYVYTEHNNVVMDCCSL